jgi:hypothetical protein
MDMSRTTRFAAATTAVLALTLIIVACDSPSGPDHNSLATRESVQKADFQRQVAEMKAATARYNNIANARADGYVDDGFGCVQDPQLGGMGWHLIRDDLHADPTIDPLHPELLVYMPQKNGQMKLVALEYEVYQADWNNAGFTGVPFILDQPFLPLEFPGLDPVYERHVWLWENNPAGMFEDFNPAIACP